MWRQDQAKTSFAVWPKDEQCGLYQHQSEIKHFINILSVAFFAKGEGRGRKQSWKEMIMCWFTYTIIHQSGMVIFQANDGSWNISAQFHFSFSATVSKTKQRYRQKSAAAGIAIWTEVCWEMFCLPIPPDRQSIKDSEPISLSELFNTNWPLLLRVVNDVCHFNAIRLAPFSIKPITDNLPVISTLWWLATSH